MSFIAILNVFAFVVFQPPEDEEVWARNIIRDKELIVAHLGPTGGRKGYGSITGEPPSEKSVCWWINGYLMPEIYVERGKTYYFRVQVRGSNTIQFDFCGLLERFEFQTILEKDEESWMK